MATDQMTTTLMTTEQFLALPEDDTVTRELIEGVLWERPMTTRNARHSAAIIRIGQSLANWLDEHPEIKGEIAGGEARCSIRRNPDTLVGIDVAFFEGIKLSQVEGSVPFFDGPPVLAVEVLSPSDTHEQTIEKVRGFIDAGTAQVWVADPDFQTITVYRPNQRPRLFNADQTIDGGADLPGFAENVAALFFGKRSRSE